VIQQALARLLDGHDLSSEDARESMNTIMRGDATQALEPVPAMTGVL